MPRIWPAASGLRPIAWADRPARMPMPMPGPMTPRAARPAPMCSMSRCSSCCPGRTPGFVRTWWLRRRWRGFSGRAGAPCGSVAVDRVERLLGEWPSSSWWLSIARTMNISVRTLKIRAWIALSISSSAERDRDERDRQRRDDAEGDLAAVDVAEESHRQRDRLDELEHQLDQADEHGDDAGADAVPELVEREELAEVAADAELPEALDLEDQEADEGHPDRDVHVARRRPQELDLADRRDQPDPVVEQDQQERADEDRDVRRGRRRRRARARSRSRNS